VNDYFSTFHTFPDVPFDRLYFNILIFFDYVYIYNIFVISFYVPLNFIILSINVIMKVIVKNLLENIEFFLSFIILIHFKKLIYFFNNNVLYLL
jgi:hypothetical protein